MDFTYHNFLTTVWQVIQALQPVQDSPQQLTYEGDQRYDEPPPPYPESMSDETSQSPTPEPHVEDSWARYKRIQVRNSSRPFNQFQEQTERERERLEHQRSEDRFGRRQTLLWDDSLDIHANADNNVRSRWVEQGIWGDEWGPAWPKDSRPMTADWEDRGGGPFRGPHYDPMTTKTWPAARWGHEKPDPLNPPQRRLEPWEAPGPRFSRPIPTVRDPEASRPCKQFWYQVSREREWIRDGMYNKGPVDLDAMAYEGVKNNWIKDKIWNPEWDLMPGETWLHEEPEEEVVEAPATSDDSGTRPRDTVDGSQQAHRPQSSGWGIFGLAPSLEVTDNSTNGSPTQASGGSHQAAVTHSTCTQATTVNNRQQTYRPQSSGWGIFGLAPSFDVTDNSINGSPTQASGGSHQVAVTHGTQDPEQAPQQSLRNTRSSQPETQGDQGSSAVCKRQRLNTSEDLSPSECSVPSPPRQSKLSGRSNAVENERPAKRPRRNTQHSVLSFHNTSDIVDTNKESHDSKAVVTNDVMQVKTPPCDEMAASTSRRTRGKGVRTASIPLRRSSRISEQRQEEQPASRAKVGNMRELLLLGTEDKLSKRTRLE